MKFSASVVVALSLIFQLTAAKCGSCTAKGMGGTLVCTVNGVGCGKCCSTENLCQQLIELGECKSRK
ncbi:hypothetical protein Vi05172_g13193 [Venturia inaequalis]|nr:hypothetical protein Vi05172_g13193 [Venturia inaequalis]